MRSAPKPTAIAAADLVPPVPTLRISAAWGLPGLAQELGFDLGRALKDADLPADLFSSRENLATYAQVERLLLACEQRSGRDDFGLLLGQRSRLADMGLAGQAALCAATAGEGLRRFIEHFNLHDTAATVTLLESGEYAIFAYGVSEHGLGDTRHFQLAGVTIACNILQDLFGPEWRPVEVKFATRSPSDTRPCQRYFHARVAFDADESSIVFARHWLTRPLPPVGAQQQREIEQAVRRQRAQMRADFPGIVRRVLRKQVLLGDVSMPAVAARLAIHRRTLDRYLQRHGLTFGTVLESVREDVARQLLHDTNLPIQQVAETVRFASAASFSTAFRRRTGMTPREFRQRARKP